MKTFNKITMSLFDSTKASFKLSVDAIFMKANPTGGVSPLVYIGNTGIGNLSPNIYLTFTYKSDEYNKGNFLYMSYPQIFKLRECMTRVKDLLTGNGFGKDEGGNIFVKQEAAAPIIIDGIGKLNKWLAFKLCVIKEDNGAGVISSFPGVSIQISSVPGNYVSTLSDVEFMTIYSIIMDLNLPQLQCSMALAYMMQNNMVNDGQPQFNSYQQNYQQQSPRYNDNSGYSNTYHYNNGGNSYGNQYQQNTQQPYHQSAQRTSYRTAQPQAQPQRTYQQKPIPQAAPVQMNDAPYHTPVQAEKPQAGLPPRADSSNIMNFKAVEDTPISEVDYDDAEAIDEIFKNVK